MVEIIIETFLKWFQVAKDATDEEDIPSRRNGFPEVEYTRIVDLIIHKLSILIIYVSFVNYMVHSSCCIIPGILCVLIIN